MIDCDCFFVDFWCLIEMCYLEEGVGEMLFLVGNGYFGLCGNYIEGCGVYEYGIFINGLYEMWLICYVEQVYGFVEVGQMIVNVFDVKVMCVYVDDELILFDDVDVWEFVCLFDMCIGVFECWVVWEMLFGKWVWMCDQWLVSFEECYLVVL